MQGNLRSEFIVLDFGTKRPRVRIPPLRLRRVLIYNALRFSVLGDCYAVLPIYNFSRCKWLQRRLIREEKPWQKPRPLNNKDSLHISIRNKLQLNAHSHAGGQALQRTDGGVGIATLQLADIALGNPGFFGKLFSSRFDLYNMKTFFIGAIRLPV